MLAISLHSGLVKDLPLLGLFLVITYLSKRSLESGARKEYNGQTILRCYRILRDIDVITHHLNTGKILR